MSEFILIFIIIWMVIGLRTASFWLQSWQIREYRWDRMKAHISTKEGTRNLLNLWFFPGILPRPKLSGRLILIGTLFLILSIEFAFFMGARIGMIFTVLLWERLIFLFLALSVFLSNIPVTLEKKNLFRRAKGIVNGAHEVTVIGITGSFGKSSTKAVLVHLLQSKFGTENILYTPGNQNNEVAIARLILKEWKFFCDEGTASLPESKPGPSKSKFFVVEVGAYASGEIQTVCDFIAPQIGILTGVNAQHLSLFGSQKKIQKAKFELAEGTSEKVFFNAESPLLKEIFAAQEIEAVPVPIASSVVWDVQDSLAETVFMVYGEKMILPWPGKFYIMNALLAMETARELGMTPKEISASLPTLPPLKRALTIEHNKKGVVILKNLYSANPNGVLAAMAHLAKCPGRKIFVSLPLLELGVDAEPIHRQIFNELRCQGAEVFWWKSDFQDLGIKICGAHFHGKDLKELKAIYSKLKKGDAILLESRLPKPVTEIFQ